MTGNGNSYYRKSYLRHKIDTILERKLQDMDGKELLLLIKRNKHNEYIAELYDDIAQQMNPNTIIQKQTRVLTFD